MFVIQGATKKKSPHRLRDVNLSGYLTNSGLHYFVGETFYIGFMVQRLYIHTLLQSNRIWCFNKRWLSSIYMLPSVWVFHGCEDLEHNVMNDFPVIGYPCFAHRILGSPGGKHCESLQRNVWRGVVSPLKTVSSDIECRILPWFLWETEVTNVGALKFQVSVWLCTSQCKPRPPDPRDIAGE